MASARFRLLIAAPLLAAPVIACGLSAVGVLESSDPSGGADSSTSTGPSLREAGDRDVDEDAEVTLGDGGDGAAVDANVDDGSTFRCGTVDVPSCLTCEAGIYACAGDKTCVADCKTCDASPVQCVACTGGGVLIAAAVCEPLADAGACTAPPLAHCACDAATDCPGARQVCKSAGCAACGEDGTDGLKCKGPPSNKACDSDGTGNSSDEQTCR